MARKFEQKEIDIIYEQLRPEEEVLWRGKPKLVPNLSYMTTLMFLFISLIIFIMLRLAKLDSIYIFKDWFTVSLVIMAVLLVFYTIGYSRDYHKKINHIFYVISNTRLVIFDSKKEKIIFSKLYNTIKVLRYKKTIFDSGTIIFDIDFVDERIKELGFINIDDAEEVMNKINHQIHHTRNKETS